MYKKFEIANQQLRTRTDYKNQVLDQKLRVLQSQLDTIEFNFNTLYKDQAQIKELQRKSANKKMEEAIEAKNSILRNPKHSLAHATKAYKNAIRVYKAKLVEFGIPDEELGHELLKTNTSNMPTSLVAA